MAARLSRVLWRLTGEIPGLTEIPPRGIFDLEKAREIHA